MSYKDDLDSQIREQFGKTMYSYTCHWEEIGILSSLNGRIKNGEIFLTAVSTTGIVTYLITDGRWSAIVGAVFSALALALTLYSRENPLEEKITKHQKTADDLWLIREKYLSLLTDFEKLSEDEVREKRDELTDQLSAVYKTALPTSPKAYSNAQTALKDKEYQYFSTEELNKMLPEHLRKYADSDVR